jgi:circadian clock protein KaiC
MGHSNQIREFLITDHGVHLVDMYVSRDGALVGSARVARETFDREREKVSADALRRLRMRKDERRRAYKADVAARRAALLADLEELERSIPLEPPAERAARAAELQHRKRI